MPAFAMIVVVQADDVESATLDETLADRWLFVGDPWEVEPTVGGDVSMRVTSTEPEFDTETCIRQHSYVEPVRNLLDL